MTNTILSVESHITLIILNFYNDILNKILKILKFSQIFVYIFTLKNICFYLLSIFKFKNYLKIYGLNYQVNNYQQILIFSILGNHCNPATGANPCRTKGRRLFSFRRFYKGPLASQDISSREIYMPFKKIFSIIYGPLSSIILPLF